MVGAINDILGDTVTHRVLPNGSEITNNRSLTTTNDPSIACSDLQAKLAKVELQRAEVDMGADMDDGSQEAQPEVQADRSKRINKKGKRKNRTGWVAIESAPK